MNNEELLFNDIMRQMSGWKCFVCGSGDFISSYDSDETNIDIQFNYTCHNCYNFEAYGWHYIEQASSYIRINDFQKKLHFTYSYHVASLANSTLLIRHGNYEPILDSMNFNNYNEFANSVINSKTIYLKYKRMLVLV